MLSILHEDDHLLVVNKPAGQSTQAPAIAGWTLERAVRTHFNPENPAAAFAGTVHRLDRPVSGVVLWARTPEAARHVSRQFERRQVTKLYWALVAGRPATDTGIWDDWLVREQTGLGRVQTCLPGTPRAQPARTRFRIAALLEHAAWLILTPETGRMHQLRIQTASRRCPILGDTLYGSTTPFAESAIALHARSLNLAHPADNRPIQFLAPPPPSWPTLPDSASIG